MPSEIERFSLYDMTEPDPEGDWVRYTDHLATLSRTVEAEPVDTRPSNCRFRLKDEGKPYPRSSCQSCGMTIATGLAEFCRRDLTPPPDQSQEIERLRARVAELEARNTRIRNEWDNCDEMLQAYRSAESRLASQERAPVVGELVIEAINDVLIDAEVEYPVGYHKGMHTITFDEDQMRAALEAALASSRGEG